MGPILKDLQHAMRQLRRNPGFAVTALVTLALGIGAVTTVFSVIRTAVLHPPPYAEPGRLVMLWSQNLPAGVARAGTGYANVVDWRARSRTFAGLAVFDGVAVVAVEPGGAVRRKSAVLAEPELFRVLGVSLERGRAPTTAEAERREPLAVISQALWQELGGRDDILDRTLEIDGQLFTICGVAPAGFDFLYPRTDLWLPLTFARAWDRERFNRGTESLRVIGRLAPDVSLDTARTEMRAIAGALAQEHPETNRDIDVALVPLALQVAGPRLRLALAVLAAAVAALLLIACSNVANLLLVRGVARQRDYAIRLSLGATRRRLVAQSVTENLVLGVVAAVLGSGVAWLALPAVRALSPADIPRIAEVRLDAPLLLASTVVSLVCTILAGLAPALGATRRDPSAMLHDGGRSSTEGRRSRRVRAGLVIMEFALASCLLAGAGLLTASFSRLLAVDPGFQPGGVLIAGSHFPLPRPVDGVVPYLGRLQETIGALPGVRSTGATEDILLGNRREQSLSIDDPDGRLVREVKVPTGFDSVTPGYFETMRVALRSGRFFDALDRAGSTPVVIINESLAQRLWPAQDPIGHRLRTGDGSSWLTVVGVVADMRRQGLDHTPIAQLFRPYAQAPSRALTLVIRTSGEPGPLAATIRRAAQEIDRSLPEFNVTTLEHELGRQMAPQRFNTSLLGAFAGLALVLACTGIYGLMHYSVARRTHEIGVRLALGADPAAVRHMVVREALGLAVTGIAPGLLVAFLGLGNLSGLLFEVSARDPLIHATAGALLLLVALAASYLPALRASRIDPSTLLRAE